MSSPASHPAAVSIPPSGSPLDGEALKRCTRCKRVLPVGEFAVDRSEALWDQVDLRGVRSREVAAVLRRKPREEVAYMRKRNAALREARGWRGRRTRWSASRGS